MKYYYKINGRTWEIVNIPSHPTNKILVDFINSLQLLRTEVFTIMSGLGHGTKRFYNYLCKVINKIDKDIEFYSNLKVWYGIIYLYFDWWFYFTYITYFNV